MLKLRFKNNKHNAVWLVEPKVTLGRALSNDLVVDGSSVADQHAEILVNHEKLTLVNVSGGGVLFINRTEVKDRSMLKANDVITVGKVQLQVVDPKFEPKVVPTVVRRKEEASGWALKANHSGLSDRVFALNNVTIVGRSNECDITLAAAHLSRQHAKLEIKDGQLYVRDLESSNGTYVNGRRVTESRVKRGDELRFDTLSFGVIGPAEDLGKTTVRSIRPAVPKPKSVDVEQQRVKGKPARASTALGGQARPVNPSSFATHSAQGPGKGIFIFFVIVLLAAAGAGWWYAVKNGLI